MQGFRALAALCAACACLAARPGLAQTPAAPAQPKPAAASDATSRADPRGDTSLLRRPAVLSGDQWMYRRGSGPASRAVRQTVVNVSEQGISLKTEESGSQDSSTTIHDREWGLLGSGYNDYRPALAYYSFPLYPGKRWGIDSRVSNFGADQSGRMKGEGRALDWEVVDVPAGRFLSLKIEVVIETADPGDPKRIVTVRENHWYAREVLRPVKVESETTIAGEAASRETIELLSYSIE